MDSLSTRTVVPTVYDSTIRYSILVMERSPPEMREIMPVTSYAASAYYALKGFKVHTLFIFLFLK